jgi:hypothetical protein
MNIEYSSEIHELEFKKFLSRVPKNKLNNLTVEDLKYAFFEGFETATSKIVNSTLKL